MRYLFYIIAALFVYLVIGKIAEIGYFIAFPYNFADMPSDMMLEDYSIGLFFRQIWVHIAVAIVYVFLMGEKHEALIVPILVVLFFSFDNVKLDVPFIILVNLACVFPMIVASWARAGEDSKRAEYKRKNAKENI